MNDTNVVKVIIGAATSWASTAVGVMAHHVSWLAPICGVLLSAIATFWAVRVARVTIKAKVIEMNKTLLETGKAEVELTKVKEEETKVRRDLCDDCLLKGKEPAFCPIPEEDRPPDCLITLAKRKEMKL